METKKKDYKKFKFLFYTLLIIFAFLYIMGKTGYYENKLSSSAKLTKEAILEFEKDVADGKPVDIKDYIKTDDKDYKNKYSSLGYTISNTIDTALNDGTKYIVKILEALFS